METKFTKGHWTLRNDEPENYFEILGKYGSNKTIAEMPKRCSVDKSEAEANARLISASPDLYYACCELLQIINEEDERFYNKHIEKFNKAIEAVKKAVE